MIGLLITGHGHFSEGMLHASQMIAGTNEHVKNVVFEDGMDLDLLQSKIRTMIEEQLKYCDGVIVLTDLLGGTPFNQVMMVAATHDNVEVLSGTNLPMIIEGALLAQFATSLQELADQLVTVGQAGIQRPELVVKDTESVEDEWLDGEGI